MQRASSLHFSRANSDQPIKSAKLDRPSSQLCSRLYMRQDFDVSSPSLYEYPDNSLHIPYALDEAHDLLVILFSYLRNYEVLKVTFSSRTIHEQFTTNSRPIHEHLKNSSRKFQEQVTNSIITYLKFTSISGILKIMQTLTPHEIQTF